MVPTGVHRQPLRFSQSPFFCSMVVRSASIKHLLSAMPVSERRVQCVRVNQRSVALNIILSTVAEHVVECLVFAVCLFQWRTVVEIWNCRQRMRSWWTFNPSFSIAGILMSRQVGVRQCVQNQFFPDFFWEEHIKLAKWNPRPSIRFQTNIWRQSSVSHSYRLTDYLNIWKRANFNSNYGFSSYYWKRRQNSTEVPRIRVHKQGERREKKKKTNYSHFMTSKMNNKCNKYENVFILIFEYPF